MRSRSKLSAKLDLVILENPHFCLLLLIFFQILNEEGLKVIPYLDHIGILRSRLKNIQMMKTEHMDLFINESLQFKKKRLR